MGTGPPAGADGAAADRSGDLSFVGSGRSPRHGLSGVGSAARPSRRPDPDSPVRLEPDRSGKFRLHLAPLEAVPEPASLVALRELVARMMPRVDLPEVLLEVDAWTGYLGEFTHTAMSGSATGSRMRDLSTSMAAVLIAQGCNLGFAPIVKPGHPALTRDRLSTWRRTTSAQRLSPPRTHG